MMTTINCGVRKGRTLFVSLCVSLLAGFCGVGLGDLHAQGTTATVTGTVTDSSGAGVPAAAVNVKNAGTGAQVNIQSDGQGRFTVPDLAIGTYDMQASKMGFETVLRKGITLQVGAQLVVDFSMPVGQQQQTVTVEGQVSQVETTDSTVGGLVDNRQMRELPLNGRNFEQLILLAPGVQFYTAVTLSGSQGRGNSYSISGSRAEGQALLIDGENLQTFWNRGLASISGSSLGVEAVAEFQVLTNTYSAQFGGNGGVMNSVSKSGTNAFHGSVYEFLRNSAMDARNEFDPKNIPAFRRNQYGGSVGGPIKKDKAFFFVNYEGIKQTLGEAKVAFTPGCLPNCIVTSTNSTTAQAIAGALALYPLPQTPAVNGVSTATEVASQTATENYVIGRFDYNFTDKDSLFVRYISDSSKFNEPFAGTGGSTAIPLWPDADVSHNQFTAAQWRRIITPSLINVVRASFSRPAAHEPVAPTHSALQDFPGAGRADAIVNVSNLSTLGPNLFNPFVLNQNKFLEGDDIYWTHGSHSVKMGMSVQRFDSNTFLQQFGGVQWTFTSLANFLAGSPARAIGTPVGPQYYGNRDFREIDLTPYVEDDWKVTSKLTLNLGLRWEFQTNPVEPQGLIYFIPDVAHNTGFVNVPHMTKTNPSWKNFDPRIGLAYDPFADHKDIHSSWFRHVPRYDHAEQVLACANPEHALAELDSAESNVSDSVARLWFAEQHRRLGL